MSQLRLDAIQAMVQSQLWPHDNLTEAQRTCEAALDALLDYLGSHAEDLAREAIISWGGLERAHEGIWIDARLAITSALAALRVEP